MESSDNSPWKQLVYMMPLLATPASSGVISITDFVSAFWMPIAVLLCAAAASAFACWSFPGGPAWGKALLLRKKSNLPPVPGPRGLPVFGSLLEMGALAHRRLASLAEQYNARPLMALSLGSTRLIVASQPDVAKEILASSAFADRPLKQSAQQLMFGRAMGFAPYGDHWRRLRRVAAGCLFSPRRIAAHEPLRQRETSLMLAAIRQHSASGAYPVEVRGFLQQASLSSVMGSVFGRQFTGSAESELQSMVREGFELLGAFNWADHLTWLRDWDPQGVSQRCAALVPRVNAFVQKIIDEHRLEKEKSGATAPAATAVAGDSGDFVDVLLSLQGEDKLEDADIIAVLWEMIFRGTDTTAILTEWTLAELVLNPEIQGKLQAEIFSVCGCAPVTDADVERMPLLQAVVNETLRLHPPGPLLSWARLAIHDVEVAGHHIPAGTTAMVNMWSITHDEAVWSRPNEFLPMRFLEQSFDVRGSDLRLAPFGAGRRVCPGRALGLATVRLWVARLVQEFFWGPDAASPVDLSEVLKLSCEMVKPLKAKPVPCSG